LTAVELLIIAACAGAAILTAAAAIYLPGGRGTSRPMLTFSAGLLVGIALFGVFPELGSHLGWGFGASLLATGFLLLWGINRYVYPVCPSCSHTHAHEHCAVPLHGFAPPLILAAALHSFLDGMGILGSLRATESGLSLAVPIIVSLHKIPEGLALGAILRAATASRSSALAGVAAAESVTILGAYLQSLAGIHAGQQWVSFGLGLAGGSFLYLGWHAIKGEWKNRGPVPAMMTAVGGAAGAAALQQGLRMFFR
jgi:zinc and cadmium transporter